MAAFGPHQVVSDSQLRPATLMESHDTPAAPFLRYPTPPQDSFSRDRRWKISVLLLLLLLASVGIFLIPRFESDGGVRGLEAEGESVQAEHGVVAADDGRCSAIGAEALRRGGHAVDAAVATAICLGVVDPTSSGVGGGAFIVVRSGGTGEALAFDCRETAPLAASENMYATNPSAKKDGALSAGIPGELAGLHAAWSRFGRLPWSSLLQPSIDLARQGFEVSPYLGTSLKDSEEKILSDPGLRRVLARNGRVLHVGETCRNVELSHTLEAVASEGPRAFYNGSVGEAFVRDVQGAGGLITMEDLRGYKVEVTEATKADVMGHTLLGMPPPSTGTVGMAMVLNVLESYGNIEALKAPLGIHRLVEALKHMFAIRMELGDPDFVNSTAHYVSDMLSKTFAEEVRKRIFDNTTFGPDYYMTKWSQLRDHGTSHFCIVDADRNAVSMTTTVNYHFGSGVLSPSTGIVLNNEMDDFSAPTEITPDRLPPAPTNFIEPQKRPLSSMTPIIILKDNQLAGVIGGSGGMCIIPAVVQVFLNHFVLGMEPLLAVQHARVYHRLFPNELRYENMTTIEGETIDLGEENVAFLEKRGHVLRSSGYCSVCQLVVHDLQNAVTKRKPIGRKMSLGAEDDQRPVLHGMLTAVSDPRKDGAPAGM